MMAISELGAIQELPKFSDVQIKVAKHSGKFPTFHAKVWRYVDAKSQDLGSVIIGSSNMSALGLTDGVEWDVSISAGSPETEGLLKTRDDTFNVYWEDKYGTSGTWY
jgi:HKD family nuclease